MKNIIKMVFAGLLMLAFNSTDAQTSNAQIMPLKAGDTIVVSGGAADSVFKSFTVTTGYLSMGVEVVLKAGAGTVNGKLYLYESVPGGNGSGYGQFLLTDSSALAALPAITGTANGGYTHGAIIRKTNPVGTKYLAVVNNVGNLAASPVQFSYTTRK